MIDRVLIALALLYLMVLIRQKASIEPVLVDVRYVWFIAMNHLRGPIYKLDLSLMCLVSLIKCLFIFPYNSEHLIYFC